MKKKISILSFIGLLLGICFGFLLPEMFNKISFIGTIYINLLKFIIAPILLTNIIVTIYNSKKDSFKTLLKSVIVFTIMFVSTFLLTSLILILLNPGNGYVFNETSWDGEITSFNISDIIINLLPSNIVSMVSGNSIFAIILFAFVFGICTTKVENGSKIIEIIEVLKNIFNKIFELIMYITPIAVFTLIGKTVAKYGSLILNVGAKYILLSYLCGFLAMIFIMILPVWIFAKINPITYIKKVYKVWILTFSTCSSLATLPTTIKTCNEEFGVSKKITDIVIPLGCTIHMCGGAVSFALLGIFCSQMFGLEINVITFLLMLLTSALINMAAPGIPGGGIVIGAAYLTLFNIPLSFMGLYSGIYRILDMNYTTLNVTGDITANILIDRYSKK